MKFISLSICTFSFQIMYLYYLIGYKLVNKEIHKIKSTIKDFESAQSIFEKLPSNIVQQVSLKKDSNKSIDNF